jgi:hypothetical protein
VTGGEPCPRAQLLGRRETAHVADLSHEDGGQHRPDPADGLDGPVAGVRDEAVVDVPFQVGDDVVVVVDEGVSDGLCKGRVLNL